jgi:hypothetical protein
MTVGVTVWDNKVLGLQRHSTMLVSHAVALQIVTLDRDHCIAVWKQTLIHIWRGPATAPAVGRMVEACKTLLSNGKGNVTCLVIVERSSPPPAEPVRLALARWSREMVPRMAAAVFVAEGGGFRSAIVRGVGLTLTTLVPHRVPFKFVATLQEALNELARAIPVHTGGVVGLGMAVDALRAEMDSA